MKKVLSIIMLLLIVSLTFLTFAPRVDSQPLEPSDWIRLTTNPYGDLCPDYSPDGSEIVYHAYRDPGWYNDIWVMNSDGSNKRQLTNIYKPGQPVYSPDGTKIAFAQYHNDYRTDLVIMDSNGNNIVPILSEGVNQLPQWSPDGSKIVFQRFFDSNSQAICVINVDGTGLTQLTFEGYKCYPSWSPDGAKIVFTSRCDDIYDIYIMNADGSCGTKFVENGGDPEFSPNGNKIVFMRRVSEGYSLFLLDIKSCEVRQLTEPTDLLYGLPTWSPDEKKIAFCANVYGNTDIYVIEAPSAIQALIDVDPDTLNLRSKGRWVTAYIELPEGYTPAAINVSSILLNNTIPIDPSAPTAIGDYDNDTVLDLMVKFDRAKVTQYILNSVQIQEKFMTITLNVTGKLYDGTVFQGNDTIKIIYPYKSGGCKKLPT